MSGLATQQRNSIVPVSLEKIEAGWGGRYYGTAVYLLGRDQPAVVASSQTGSFGQEVRQASIASSQVRWRMDSQSRSARISASVTIPLF
jgi:hypothetical protein